jgi:hypothetical protein
MPSEHEYGRLEGGLGDIAIEKPDPRWQTRTQPGVFPPQTGSPRKPVIDPMECRPPDIPVGVSPEARVIIEYGVKLIEKTFATAMERAAGLVAERVLARLPFAVTRPWAAATQDSQPFDQFFFGVPIPAGATRVVVGTIGPFSSRTPAVVTKVGTALESAAAFADIVWEVLVNDQPIPNIDPARGQWDTITGPAGGSDNTTFGKAPVVYPAQVFSLVASNLAAVLHTATARIAGFLYTTPYLSSTLTDAFRGTASQFPVTPESARQPFPDASALTTTQGEPE